MNALFKLSYGMYVVCSGSGDKYNGQIANALIQVSAESPQILVSINKNNLTHQLIKESNVFTVSILSKNAPMKFIGRFGFKSGRNINKFEGVDYRAGKTGAPVVISNSTGYIECEVVNSVDFATHTGFVGKLIDSQELNDSEPMTYADYHIVKGGMSPENAPTYIKDKKMDIKEEKKMGKYRCTVCGYIYDPEKGDPDSGVAPGTAFEDVSEEWVCPVCGVGKDAFEAADQE